MKTQIINSLFFIILSLVFVNCGSDGDEVRRLKFVSAKINGNYDGGIIVFGKRLGEAEEFSLGVPDIGDQAEIVLPGGDWEFSALAWDGAEGLEGVNRCGNVTIPLGTGDQDVIINLAEANCDSDVFSDPTFRQGGAFSPIRFVSCRNTSGVINGDDNCNYPLSKKGLSNSFRVKILGNTFDPDQPTQGLTSKCIKFDGSDPSEAISDIRLPIGGDLIVPVEITFFEDTICTELNAKFTYDQGLGNPGSGFDGKFFGTGTNSSHPVHSSFFIPDNFVGKGLSVFADQAPQIDCNIGGIRKNCISKTTFASLENTGFEFARDQLHQLIGSNDGKDSYQLGQYANWKQNDLIFFSTSVGDALNGAIINFLSGSNATINGTNITYDYSSDDLTSFVANVNSVAGTTGIQAKVRNGATGSSPLYTSVNSSTDTYTLQDGKNPKTNIDRLVTGVIGEVAQILDGPVGGILVRGGITNCGAIPTGGFLEENLPEGQVRVFFRPPTKTIPSFLTGGGYSFDRRLAIELDGNLESIFEINCSVAEGGNGHTKVGYFRSKYDDNDGGMIDIHESEVFYDATSETGAFVEYYSYHKDGERRQRSISRFKKTGLSTWTLWQTRTSYRYTGSPGIEHSTREMAKGHSNNELVQTNHYHLGNTIDSGTTFTSGGQTLCMNYDNQNDTGCPSIATTDEPTPATPILISDFSTSNVDASQGDGWSALSPFNVDGV